MIEPFDVKQLQPSSYDLTLGDKFLRVPESGIVDPTENVTISYVEDERKLGQDFLIMPHEFILATTKETIRLPKDVAAQVQGKSSIGRLGLFIHNAGHIDPGFHGKITLELYNASNRPISLSYVERICQVVFVRTTGNVNKTYSGKYQEQNDVIGSRSDWEYTTPPNVGRPKNY